GRSPRGERSRPTFGTTRISLRLPWHVGSWSSHSTAASPSSPAFAQRSCRNTATARALSWPASRSIPMNRPDLLSRARDRRDPGDLVVIGGGAPGAGIAVDASTRGYDVLLVERGDFGGGTSSRSTKLVHGGVRYLRQGHVGLVLEALRERGRLRRNAPHLVHNLPFVLPCYSRLDSAFYGLGLTAYDLLAGKARFGRSLVISAADVQRRLPTVRTAGLLGGVVYHDGQFDDTRLLIH